MSTEYKNLTATHPLYDANIDAWRFYYESYVGGETYRRGRHLTKYSLEDDNEYVARLRATPLDNHCDSVVSVYTAFLFKEKPEREFGSIQQAPELDPFLRDADHDGRSFNDFIKEVSIWASVYGHQWVFLVKPNINARTRADELSQGIRPYATHMSPMSVFDWEYQRTANGAYQLVYLKYVESTNGSKRVIKTWTRDAIVTSVVDDDKSEVLESIPEVNQLGVIPAVIAYNNRSSIRGMGVSDIRDIADAQKYIYNLNSEIEQGIRLSSHPSLVTDKYTEARAAGAGSLIKVGDETDPALKPYLLETSGSEVSSILNTIEKQVQAIDKMANTGSVRATESKVLSGVAMETEFQLLNARLATKADNLELVEEQIWKLFALYLGREWDGTIRYPESFNIRSKDAELSRISQSADLAIKLGDETAVNAIKEQLNTFLNEDSDMN